MDKGDVYEECSTANRYVVESYNPMSDTVILKDANNHLFVYKLSGQGLRAGFVLIRRAPPAHQGIFGVNRSIDPVRTSGQKWLEDTANEFLAAAVDAGWPEPPPEPLHKQYFNTQPHECACGINRKDCSYHG